MTTDAILEIILKNALPIIHGRYKQEITIKDGFNKLRIENVKTWAFILDCALNRFPAGTRTGDVFRCLYFSGLTNAQVIEKLHMPRQKFFNAKDKIKTFILAGACQCHTWHVISPDMARDFTIETSCPESIPQS